MYPQPRQGSRVSVLLLRLGHQQWGPLPEVPAEPEPGDQLDLKIDDAAGVTPAGRPT